MLSLGPKVISKVITEPSIDELISVIKRPPVIWDNLHANDYDQHRLFLGPYVGRSVELIPKLNGVLTNPNCEYGANYIPIHTLAQWSRCGMQLRTKSPTLAQAMILEAEGSKGAEEDENEVKEMESGEEIARVDSDCDNGGSIRSLGLYEPQKALDISLREWFLEFKVPRKKPEHYRPRKNVAMAAKANNYDDDSSASSMDTSQSGPTSSSSSIISSDEQSSHSLGTFSIEDMELLIDYFYLPHKHGSRALQILADFCWLKENAPGYELLKTHGCLKGSEDGDGTKSSPPLEDGDGRDGGMRSDGETSESVVDEDMSSVDVSVFSVTLFFFQRALILLKILPSMYIL